MNAYKRVFQDFRHTWIKDPEQLSTTIAVKREKAWVDGDIRFTITIKAWCPASENELPAGWSKDGRVLHRTYTEHTITSILGVNRNERRLRDASTLPDIFKMESGPLTKILRKNFAVNPIDWNTLKIEPYLSERTDL